MNTSQQLCLFLLLLEGCIPKDEVNVKSVKTAQMQLQTSTHLIHSTQGTQLPVVITTGGKEGTGLLPPGWSLHFCLHTGSRIHWKDIVEMQSNKIRNKRAKTYNGNRAIRNVIKITQWNMGYNRWENKRVDIEVLTQEKTPDLLFITEANLFDTLPEYQRHIQGYKMYIPEAMMRKHKYGKDSATSQR